MINKFSKKITIFSLIITVTTLSLIGQKSIKVEENNFFEKNPSWLEKYSPEWEIAPTKWLEGIPLANGDIGIMIWGDGNPLKFTLDKYDAWETEEQPLQEESYEGFKENVKKLKKKTLNGQFIYDPYLSNSKLNAKGKKYPTRLPLPRLEIKFNNKFNWIKGSLLLNKALSKIEGKAGNKKVEIKTFVHSLKNIIFIKFKNLSPGEILVKLRWDHLNRNTRNLLKSWGYKNPVIINNGNSGSLFFEGPKDFKLNINWRKIKTKDGTLIKLALISNHDSKKPIKKTKELIKESKNFKKEFTSHFAWWKNFWKKSFLSIPDFRLESLYYIELYKLGSLSRAGELPISLQGLWTLDGGMPPWSGDYHLDLNVEMSYWPIYTANHLELGKPLYDTFYKCLPKWEKQCKQFFGFDGIWSGCAIGPHGERVWGYSTVEFWPGNTAFLAHNYWLHFLYSQDTEFLKKRALPIIEKSFLIYSNLLFIGRDGKLHIPYSYSPEYYEGFVNAYDQDSNIDIALIKFLTSAIIKSHKILKISTKLTERAKYVRDNLVDFQYENHLKNRINEVNRRIRLKISKNIPFRMSHRHFSHLISIYPLSILTIENSKRDQELIKGSIEEIIRYGTGAWTGYSFPWFGAIAGRAGYNNIPLQMLDVYINGFISPNTFHINGDPGKHGFSMWHYEPMTLEGGFMAAATIQEMLLQSYNQIIRVFPAVPDVWKDASFFKLRAEGAFLVSSKLKNGKIEFIKIESLAGSKCSVRKKFKTFKIFKKEKNEKYNEFKDFKVFNKNIIFNTKKGDTYLIIPETFNEPNFTLSPSNFKRKSAHFFGKKRIPIF